MVAYAIPSYNRPDSLFKKTLSVLKHYKIDSNDITIFLHSDLCLPGKSPHTSSFKNENLELDTFPN